VKLPATLNSNNIITTDEITKTYLNEFTKRQLETSFEDIKDSLIDVIIIFTDSKGKPILPDLERSFALLPSQKRLSEMAFTFNSPSEPWSMEETDTLNAMCQAFYKKAKAIYGDPAFDNTINVRKDTSIPVAGYYNPSTNEIVIKGTYQQDVICHEIIHAFRDDFIIGLSTYEEGMTRAAEVEVFNQLDNYDRGDENHSYNYDVYYDGLNKPSIGTMNGNVFSNVTLTLLRYEISSYLWAKCFLEDNYFFRKFNSKLYALAASDPSILYTESKLKDLLQDVKSTVEDIPTAIWYSKQYILDSNPALGYKLYHRISILAIDYFYRDSQGLETPQVNKQIEWFVYDYNDALIGSGVGITSDYGWSGPSLDFPNNYYGRMKFIYRVQTPSGVVSDTSYRSMGAENGVFGVVTDSNSGNVSITALDTLVPPVSTTVINGMFSAPSLEKVRGRFRISLTYPGSLTISRIFTKDASNYFLSISTKTSLILHSGFTIDLPRPFVLLENYPNPFKESTTFKFFLESPGFTTLDVYNSDGSKIDELLSANLVSGMHTITWNAGNKPSGIYFYRLKSGVFMETRKLILLE
jgi:hypothetical protein